MKVGDLVRHRFDGSWDEIGLVTAISERKALSSTRGGAQVSIKWCYSPTIHEYRMRDLETIIKGR